MADLKQKFETGTLKKNDEKLLKLYIKCFSQLSVDPKHPGLKTHEIALLTKKYGVKVWQSYLKNHTPAAGRVFWIYGPEKGEILICGIEPHPDPGKYGRINLETTPTPPP